jgi:PAS domain S-box-containing protein
MFIKSLLCYNNKPKKDYIRRNSVLNAIITSSPAAIIVIDIESIIIEWSDKSEIIFGWNFIDVVGKNLTDIIIPVEYRQRHRDGIQRYLKTNKSKLINNKKTIELTALHKNGHTIPITLLLNQSVSKSGQILFIGFIEDISDAIEKKNTIKIMEHTTNTLNLFLMSVPSPISVFDKNIKCIFKNKAFASINYCVCYEYKCKCIYQILNSMLLFDKITSVIKTGNSINLKSQSYHNNNSYYNIDIIRAIYDNKCLILVYFIDVTDKINSDINNNYYSEFIKNNFLNNYQIKFNFINKFINIVYSNTIAINNYINIYKNNIDYINSDETNFKSNNTILDNTILNKIILHNNYLHSISCKINNFSDLNSIEPLKSKKINLTNFNGVIDYIYDHYTNLSQKYNITFILDVSLNIKDNYKIHYGNKIITILHELIDNSFKFYKNKTIVTLSIYDYDTYINIIIDDTGIGIKNEFLDKIFEPFYKIDKKDKKSLGLGLYIVKSIILMLQANINITSIYGQNTTVSINIPYILPI